MSQESNKAGIDLLIMRYKKLFRVPENLDYYSEDDYRLAEKKFLKHALIDGENLTMFPQNTS